MANLNSEDILASSSYVCGERKGTLHARAHSPRRAGPGRGGVKYAGTRHPREWSAEIRLLALLGAWLPFTVFIFGCLAVRFARYGRSSRFPNLITDPITTRGRGLSYIYNLSATTKINLI